MDSMNQSSQEVRLREKEVEGRNGGIDGIGKMGEVSEIDGSI